MEVGASATLKCTLLKKRLIVRQSFHVTYFASLVGEGYQCESPANSKLFWMIFAPSLIARAIAVQNKTLYSEIALIVS